MAFRRRRFKRSRRFGRRRFKRGSNMQSTKTISALLNTGPAFVSSNIAGALTQVYPLNDPSITTDWANYAAIYDQFRVVAMKLTLIPTKPDDSSSVTNYTPLYHCIDRNDQTFLGSVADATAYASLKLGDMTKPIRRYVKCNTNSTERAWRATVAPGTGPIVTGAMKIYASSLNASSNYLVSVVHYYCQFRGNR